MPLSAPQMQGDILKPADIQNHMLVVAPTEFIPSMMTQQGDSAAIRVNVADFSVTDAAGQPTIYNGVLWFNTLLHGNLKRQIGQYILGQMAVGQATPGRNAPFQLVEVTDSGWQSHCGNWLDNSAEGQAFQAQTERDIQQAGVAAQVGQVAQAAPASAPPAPPTGPTPPAVPQVPSVPAAPASGFPSAPVLGSPAPAAVAPAAPAGPAGNGPDLTGVPAGLHAMIAALPAEQQAMAIAVARAQADASS